MQQIQLAKNTKINIYEHGRHQVTKTNYTVSTFFYISPLKIQQLKKLECRIFVHRAFQNCEMLELGLPFLHQNLVFFTSFFSGFQNLV